ncbi:MAG: glycosyltransferase family 4 protein [Clostridia bacterium]|nr:glycosyltransferase family 4 protein [Clostridia bacterium]
MKKVLFVATVDSHIRHFHIPYLKYFKENGYEVHVATANDENEVFDYCDKKHTVTFERNPLKSNNIKAIKQMKKIFEEENFDIVHCHTPMGGVITRIAAKDYRKKGLKVFYTAHGFHFFKGAPLINWLVYYPVEKWLARHTDVLITINEEDFNRAKKFKAKRIEKIDGIGVKEEKFKIELTEEEKNNLKKEFEIADNDIVLTYVAELIPRKNQALMIDAMQEIVLKNKNIKLLLVGTGILKGQYEKQIKDLKLENNVILTGYRRDVPKIFRITDIVVSSSTQEGLPVNLVEAQMSSLPTISTNVRGNNEVTINEENGYLVNNKNEMIEKILLLSSNKELRETMGKNANQNSKKYTLENTLIEMSEIYNIK